MQTLKFAGHAPRKLVARSYVDLYAIVNAHIPPELRAEALLRLSVLRSSLEQLHGTNFIDSLADSRSAGSPPIRGGKGGGL